MFKSREKVAIERQTENLIERAENDKNEKRENIKLTA